MITYRAEELAQSGRMLTIYALYRDYTGGHCDRCSFPLAQGPSLGPPQVGDAQLLLHHFGRIRAHAQWLLYRFGEALRNFPDPSDPRHGTLDPPEMTRDDPR